MRVCEAGLIVPGTIAGGVLTVTLLGDAVVPVAVIVALEQPVWLKYTVTLVEVWLSIVPQVTVQPVAEHEPFSV